MSDVMSPRLVLCAKDPDGAPSFPATVDDSGTLRRLFRGAPRPLDMGGYPAREYRDGDGDLVFVLQRLAVSTTRVLALVWVPSSARNSHPTIYQRIGAALIAAGVVLRSWGCVLASDGTFEIPLLEADGTAAGVAVKAAWPAGWRRYLAGEHPAIIDPTTGAVTSPQVGPSGPCILGSVLA